MKTVKTISVIGQARCDFDLADVAEKAGEIIGNFGFVLITGGLSGVMEFASKGAKKAGGTTVGILPGYDRNDANKYVDLAVPTGLNHARNVVVVSSGDFIVSIGGGYGTMSEISIAFKLGKDIISYHSPIDHQFNFSGKGAFFSHLKGTLGHV
ncbi:MAG TPA: TIGR00725 family protein [Flexistipes sinusarabici]|uniref:TIGR00725 family protein n=1 Tax=Flexistipes sinusarabici TaxID=2352 RepID=A0A3D5QC26_FLESI|nr:TIGR00725 family protein [Flexistipes sinusarabici]